MTSLTPLSRGIRGLALSLGLLLGAFAAAAAAETAAPLVSPQWLKARLGDPGLVVLDIRSAIDGGGYEAYTKGHVPGAIHTDYDKGGWRVTRNSVPLMLPTQAELERLLGELGIEEDRHVVIVPAGVHATDFGSAARVYWTLKVAGHDKVSILDGGFAAWRSDPANPVQTGNRRPSPGIYSVSINKRLLAEAGDVEVAAQSNATLLDGRPADFFLGKVKSDKAKAYGHIPGAINFDNARFYDPATNRIRPKAELEALARAIPDGPVVSYCNTGHWAATNWFVLSELLGRKDVSLYDGSMVEWTADTGRPVSSLRTKWDDLKKALGFGS